MAVINTVFVPVDFSSNTGKVVDYAMSVADQLGAKVLFFHVVNNFKGYDMMLVHPSFINLTKDLEHQAGERMTNLISDYKDRKNGVGGNVILGDVAEEILNYAAQEKADVTIIGTHGTKGLEKILMGSTADQVIKKAACPVLLFNPFK